MSAKTEDKAKARHEAREKWIRHYAGFFGDPPRLDEYPPAPLPTTLPSASSATRRTAIEKGEYEKGEPERKTAEIKLTAWKAVR